MKNLIISLLFLNLTVSLMAQNFSVTGHVYDSKHNPLPGTTIYLTSKTNPDVKKGNVAAFDGSFVVNGLAAGTYSMQISFVGYSPQTQNIVVKQKNQNLGSFTLREQSIKLGEVKAVGRETRAIQLSDTLRYNADAFKTIQGANVETLISKMPGIVVDGSGTVQAQGETVKKVLVDGKPFFDGDPTLALRSLPADIVQNIEVFDKKSEQAEFTGFDDGNSQKTINVVTRKGFQFGVFGKITGGIGVSEDDKIVYQGSASINLFRGNQRLTLLGMSNNINQQNFSQEDLAGVMSGGGGRGGRGGGSQSGGGGNSSYFSSGSGGLTKTNAGGLNYTDKWGSKIDVVAGYFYNNTDNTLDKNSLGTYFKTDSEGRTQTYDEQDNSTSTNMNHRFNLKFDYKIDDNNSLTFMPSATFQTNNSNSTMLYNTYLDKASSTKTNTLTKKDVTANSLSGMLLFRHKFAKQSRTISLAINASSTKNDNNGYTEQHFTNTSLTEDEYLKILSNSNGYSIGSNISYTEPIGKSSMLQAAYRVNYNHNNIDKKTLDYLTMELDTALSNLYNSDYVTHQIGMGYHLRKQNGFMLMANLDGQIASLTGDQTYPSVMNTDKSYNSLLPSFLMNYRINSFNSIRVSYRTSTSAPSITQLQNVIDNSNPAAVTGGNPNLDQQISNNYLFRYTYTPKTGQTFIVMLNASNTLHYIGNSTILATQDSVLQEGITLRSGAQYSTPVNLSGMWSANSLITVGFPVDFLKSNLNLSSTFGYNQLPALYNNVKQITRNYTITPKLILGSNISDKFDFTLTYSAAFNIARNNSSSSANSTYLTQTTGFKLDWILWNGFTLQNVMNYQNYSGTTSGSNQNIFLWNAGIGKKMFNNRGEIKLQAYDILSQNKSLVRNVSDNYYEDVTTNVMKPYVMLTFTYDLRNFRGQQYRQKQQDMDKQRKERWRNGDMPDGPPPGGVMPPSGGMPPGGGAPPGGE
jgi:hypothetical protein